MRKSQRISEEKKGFSGGSAPAKQETQVQSLGRKDPLEKEQLLTPAFLPGESHGQRSLVGYSPWTGKESDMTDCLEERTREKELQGQRPWGRNDLGLYKAQQ